MPYSGPDDSKLPSNVKRLSDKGRRRWVAIWNGSYDGCIRDGGDTSKCEGLAFRTANGVIFENDVKERIAQLVEMGLSKGEAYIQTVMERAAYVLAVREETMELNEKMAKARTPKFDGVETTNWAGVKKTFAAYRDGYYKHTGTEKPDDVPGQVQQAPPAMKTWIASKTLLGDANAQTESDLIAYPVVNPVTNKLNAGALRNASSRGGQALKGDAKTSLQAKTRSLLDKHFKKEEQDANPEEYYSEPVYYTATPVSGNTTFADLMAAEQAQEIMERAQMRLGQLGRLLRGILHSETPDKLATMRARFEEFMAVMEELFGSGSPLGKVVVEMAEADVGSVISIVEDDGTISSDGKAMPLKMEVALVKPGWGNKKDNHYYDGPMLAEYANVFEGAKMYATNHNPDEKNVLTEVSQILECPVGFTDDGAPLALVGVYDNRFAESIRNRDALGKLEDLHVSIQASGTGRPFEKDGRKGVYIESISGDEANVDWVTRAGAGGHAHRILEENEKETDDMNDKDKKPDVSAQEQTNKPPLQGGGSPETQQPPIKGGDTANVAETQQPSVAVTLSEADVDAVLKDVKLPDISKNRLKSVSHADVGALQKAIAQETEYVKSLTQSGQPTAQEASAPVPEHDEQAASKAYMAELDAIDERFGYAVTSEK